MTIAEIPPLTHRGNAFDTSSQRFGELRRSDDVADNPEACRQRMAEDGYVFLPGYLNQDEVKAARQEVFDRLAEQGVLDSSYPAYDGIADPHLNSSFRPDLAINNDPLMKVLYEGPMMNFFKGFLGGPVRHFDYTWFRAKGPDAKNATTPHYDVVYMGRGTKNLYTAWVPFIDIPFDLGGLIVLENSHRNEELRNSYGEMDVDEYCTNYDDAEEIRTGQKTWQKDGAFSGCAIDAQEKLGGRWLTTEYKMGDLLVFSMYLMHASPDNHSNRIRISSDSRYQLASEPVDERWIGENPIAHGVEGKRGKIC